MNFDRCFNRAGLMAKSPWNVFFVLLLVMNLNGCNSITPYSEPKDSAPIISVNPDKVLDAVPRQDAITRAGNKNPYTVLGTTYHLLPASKGYSEEGVASWYGTKFHGRPTANGERYNLYAMTAAHRTLPIPAYVKVTNLDNNRTAIVRVNDRGPFHDNRIIDLSYAAAVKLGYSKKGTARVRVEAIVPKSFATTTNASKQAEQFLLQVGAFKSLELATQFRQRLSLVFDQNIVINPNESKDFYRVQLGPLASIEQVKMVSEQLVSMEILAPHVISVSQ
jgi:rare lipoprotein A